MNSNTSSDEELNFVTATNSDNPRKREQHSQTTSEKTNKFKNWIKH